MQFAERALRLFTTHLLQNTPSVLHCRAVFPIDPDNELGLASLQTEKTSFPDPLSQHKVVLNVSQNTPEKEALACTDTISAPCALQRQVSDLRAENVFLKEMNLGLMHNAVSDSNEKIGKKLDRLFATNFISTFGIVSKLDQWFWSLLASKVLGLCSSRNPSTCDWHSRSKQPH